jgi:peptide deformylase|tara:strand:+ start:154 stop:738 length:585 start_codon:yes stop_codon:yes gene_type:complete
MILPIVNYGDPVLRARGARIETFDSELHELVENMLETMDEAHGVGLAAQQIGKAIQLTVIDVTEVSDRPSTLELNGKEVNIEEYMPLILINPELKPFGKRIPGPEGCLSFPEIYDDINRPESVSVKAQDEDGELLEFTCGGLLARVIQHETDHLKGILFIDHMDRETKTAHQEEIDQIQTDTKALLEKKRKPNA